MFRLNNPYANFFRRRIISPAGLSDIENVSARALGFKCLCAFLVTAALFAGAHLLHPAPPFESEKWLMTYDRGFAEYFQYALILLAAALVALVYWGKRSSVAALIAATLVYLFADDAFQIHEKAGYAIAETGLFEAFRPIGQSHVGEFVFLLSVGGILLSALFLAARRQSETIKAVAIVYAALFVFHGVFAVLVDAVHAITHAPLLGFVEDGGELVITCLIAGFSVFLASANSNRLTKVRKPATEDLS